VLSIPGFFKGLNKIKKKKLRKRVLLASKTLKLENTKTYAHNSNSGPPDPNIRQKVESIINDPGNPVLNGPYNITILDKKVLAIYFRNVIRF
jgi:hypothetical protein